MKNWIRRTLCCVVCITAASLACERKPAQPVKSPPPTAPTAPGNDAKGLAEFLSKDKARSGATSQNAGDALPPGHPPLDAPAQTMAPPDDVTPLKYDAPPTWKRQPPSSAMRKAQFLLPRAGGDSEDGQLIVFQFGRGQGGAVEMNIQRWVGMFTTKDGQPVSGAAVKRETREVNGLKVTTLDVSGNFADAMMGMGGAAAPKENYRMLAAIVETPDGPWFFKGVGPEATMAAHREAFITMLDTVRR